MLLTELFNWVLWVLMGWLSNLFSWGIHNRASARDLSSCSPEGAFASRDGETGGVRPGDREANILHSSRFGAPIISFGALMCSGFS